MRKIKRIKSKEKESKMNSTLIYYEKHAKEFAKQTTELDFSETQDKFLQQLKKGDFILDFGCGSGRDTKYFLEQGFCVEAVDGSEKMCEIATGFTGIEVKEMLFQELNVVEKYNGIWACSSVLHLSKKELKDVMVKMRLALKKNGIIYMSFKYGTFEGERNGRYFTDMTEKIFENFLKEIEGIKVKEQWITSDIRSGRKEEKWLNIILKRE